MNDLLTSIWPLMDAVDPVFSPYFSAKWPEGTLAKLIDLGLVSQIHDADCVMCPFCWDHDEEVIALEGPPGKIRYWIPCPDSLRVEIPPNLLWQWTVNFGAVARQLAVSMQLVGEPVEIGSDRLWRLGRGTFEGYLHDVLFARRVDNDGADLLAACGGSLRPFVLFGREVPRQAWWLDKRIPSESLRRVATFSTHGVVVDRAPVTEIIAQFEQLPVQYAFRRRGEFWELAFRGKTIHLKDSLGLCYIARLLKQPGRSIPAVALLAAQAGIDPLAASGSSGEVLDDAARVNYSRRYQELCDEVETATRNHDLSTLERLQTEKDQLLTELAAATGLGGRGRTKTDADKVRRSVTMAVSRDLERIGNEHMALGRHLDNAITSGLVFRYAPAEEIPWVT